MNKIFNKISVVVCTRNAEKYIEKCLDSALNQNYPDFEVIFIDDCSNDETFEKAKIFEKKYSNLTAIKNEERKYLGENMSKAVEISKEKSIIVTLDGDDWFPHENVLMRINKEYTKHNCWMTYGTYVEYPYREVYFHYHEYPLNIRQENNFRSYKWLASHARTFRRELFLKIDKNDMKDPSTDKYFTMALDLAFQFPMLEMCGVDKSRYIPDIIYVYNKENPVNETKVNQLEVDRIENILRNKKKYQKLDNLYEN